MVRKRHNLQARKCNYTFTLYVRILKCLTEGVVLSHNALRKNRINDGTPIPPSGIRHPSVLHKWEIGTQQLRVKGRIHRLCCEEIQYFSQRALCSIMPDAWESEALQTWDHFLFCYLTTSYRSLQTHVALSQGTLWSYNLSMDSMNYSWLKGTLGLCQYLLPFLFRLHIAVC